MVRESFMRVGMRCMVAATTTADGGSARTRSPRSAAEHFDVGVWPPAIAFIGDGLADKAATPERAASILAEHSITQYAIAFTSSYALTIAIAPAR